VTSDWERRARAVKARAKAELGGIDGVQGVGIGDQRLRVYVRSDDVRARIPDAFDDVPIEVVVVGDIEAR
jgi:hypothetical protein